MLTIGHFVNWLPLEVFAAAFLTFVLCTRLSLRMRIVWTLLLAAGCAKFWFYGAFGGSRCNPTLPAALLLAWNCAFSWAAWTAVFGCCWWHRRSRPAAVPIAALALALAGNWNGLRLPDVREVELAYPALPPDLDGYRIVQVSDLHATVAMRRWRTAAVVRAVNALDADLVCITGDLVDGEPSVSAAFVEPVRDLRAKDGVWAVTGNHEFFYLKEGWTRFYDAWGIRFVSNACVFPRRSLALGGVNDPEVLRRVKGAPRPDVGRAFAAATNGEFRVLMQHQPKGARENLVRHGVDLQLSGHTHGGFMPVISSIISRSCDGFIRGLYGFGGKRLYVSPGCGQCAWLPVRYLNPPEVTVFTLKKGEEK